MGFQKAKREQIWLKVLLTSPSGGGKSYSALRLATGIAKKANSRIAFIGTEGSRDKYYANEFDYDLLQLEEPYTDNSYIDALEEAIDLGYQVVIIDSLSHEWKWLNDQHDKMPGNSFQNWGKLKPRHRKFMDSILNAPVHIIATARGKDEWVMEEKSGKQVPKKIGLGAQQDKDVTYDYTVSLMIEQDTHIASSDKDNTHLFEGRYEILTENDGERLYEWANNSDIPATVKPMPKKVNDDKNAELVEIITTAFKAADKATKDKFKVLRKELAPDVGTIDELVDLPTEVVEQLAAVFNEED